MDALTINQALKALSNHRRQLTRQQFKTLRGQILAGDLAGAARGLETIKERRKKTDDHRE